MSAIPSRTARYLSSGRSICSQRARRSAGEGCAFSTSKIIRSCAESLLVLPGITRTSVPPLPCRVVKVRRIDTLLNQIASPPAQRSRFRWHEFDECFRVRLNRVKLKETVEYEERA